MTAFATSIPHRDDPKKQNENLHIKFLNLSASASSKPLSPTYPSPPLSEFLLPANPTTSDTARWSAYL
jgi:hypothetical protein